jgi:hypothetical protein
VQAQLQELGAASVPAASLVSASAGPASNGLYGGGGGKHASPALHSDESEHGSPKPRSVAQMLGEESRLQKVSTGQSELVVHSRTHP